jgi:hypothetical protein
VGSGLEPVWVLVPAVSLTRVKVVMALSLHVELELVLDLSVWRCISKEEQDDKSQRQRDY